MNYQQDTYEELYRYAVKRGWDEGRSLPHLSDPDPVRDIVWKFSRRDDLTGGYKALDQVLPESCPTCGGIGQHQFTCITLAMLKSA